MNGEEDKAIKIVLKDLDKIIKRVKKEDKKSIKKEKFKLFLNIKNNINKLFTNIIRPLKKSLSTINRIYKSTEIKEIISDLKYVIGYGLLGWTALYTFANFKFHIIFVLGCGSLIYLVYDFIDFVVNKLKKDKK